MKIIILLTILINIQSLNAYANNDVLIKTSVEDAISKIKSELNDPYTAVFSDIYYIHKFEKSYSEKRKSDPLFNEVSELVYVCGQVNFKNKYGAYAGNTVFYYNGSNAEVLLHEGDEYETNMFKSFYDLTCKKSDSDIAEVYKDKLE
jgi:hypothetical protein